MQFRLRRVWDDTPKQPQPSQFWFLWEYSLAVNLPKSAAPNNRTVGLYAKSRLEWKGNNQESQLWHTIGIGTDLENYDAQADCVHQRDVRCVDPMSFDGAVSVTGNVNPARQYLSVFSSARGRCWKPYGYLINARQNVNVPRMILYIP